MIKIYMKNDIHANITEINKKNYNRHFSSMPQIGVAVALKSISHNPQINK